MRIDVRGGGPKLKDARMKQSVPKRGSQRCNVLIVDDDPEIVEVLEEVLREEGFAASGYTDPTLALSMLQKEPAKRPDLILLDCVMPLMTGGEFLEALRKSEIETPVLMLTALSDPNFCVAPGAAHVINKPFDLDQLVAEISANARPAN